jgi:hypothetical protein
MGAKVLTVVACVGVVVISLIVLDLSNPFSPLGVVMKSIPYVGVWAVSKLTGHPRRLALSLAGGLATFLVTDAYVSFYAIRRPQSSTDPVAAMVVLLASAVIIPAGALITFLLLRLSGGAYRLVKR